MVQEKKSGRGEKKSKKTNQPESEGDRRLDRSEEAPKKRRSNFGRSRYQAVTFEEEQERLRQEAEERDRLAAQHQLERAEAAELAASEEAARIWRIANTRQPPLQNPSNPSTDWQGHTLRPMDDYGSLHQTLLPSFNQRGTANQGPRHQQVPPPAQRSTYPIAGHGHQQQPGPQFDYPVQTTQSHEYRQPPRPAPQSNDPTRGNQNRLPPLPSPPTLYQSTDQAATDPSRYITPAPQPASRPSEHFPSNTPRPASAHRPTNTRRSDRMAVDHFMNEYPSESSDDDRSRKHYKPNERRH